MQHVPIESQSGTPGAPLVRSSDLSHVADRERGDSRSGSGRFSGETLSEVRGGVLTRW